jgi:hypothetical protein
MGLKEIKNKLKDLNKEALVELIIGFYQKNKSLKDQMDYYFDPKENEILQLYKSKVLEAFYPKRGDMFHLKIGKQAISDFKKLNPSLESQIDLMIYYVECGVKLTNEFGDIDEKFYSSLEGVYRDALKLIDNSDLHDKFNDRAFGIVEDTKDIGWGFHDYLGDLYYQTYQ